MKQRITKKMAVVVLASLCCVSGALAVEIDQVVVRQRWPWSRLVDIDYVLSCDPAETMDINVTGYNGAERLALPLSSLSGDLFNVSEGTHRIVWDPMATAYTNRGVLTSFSVALEAMVTPLYMIVDLTKDAGADGQILYVHESDLRTGTWGSWVENPVTNAGTVIQSVIWTGVTNDSIYATDKLVLRRVSAGAFENNSVTLTKDCYVGVFQVTQKQWHHMTGNWPGYFKDESSRAYCPVENVSYDDIRGATNNNPEINWPSTGYVVSPSSFLATRLKTGLDDFDLPTHAQWKYACRAGTTTLFNDGNGDANVTGDNANANAWLDVLGRYNFNKGQGSVAIVGSYVPNAWGLYDMHGNVREWCLDWYAYPLSSGNDPGGPDSGSFRMEGGGSWNYPAKDCRPTSYAVAAPTMRNYAIGFRLVRTLP